MKQNISIPKKELSEVLKDYPTKNDVKNLLKDYPTKSELSDILNRSFEAFRQENNHNFQMMMDRFDEKFSKFTNLILTAIDPLLKELETRQLDRELTTKQIADLDRRVSKLENTR